VFLSQVADGFEWFIGWPDDISSAEEPDPLLGLGQSPAAAADQCLGKVGDDDCSGTLVCLKLGD
jgi:hypothetical protein